MNITSVFRRFRRSDRGTAASTSKLSAAADAVASSRQGTIVHGDAGPESPDAIANLVAAANDALFVDRSNEDRVLTNSTGGYRRSK